jgi:hypothetical protein
MIRTLRVISCLLLAGVLLHCTREEKLLVGDWQAVSVTENGDSLRLNPAEIGFTFREDKRYSFRSTLRYSEAGRWRYDHGFLFATDTTHPGLPERIVAIDRLTLDSLILRMRADSAEREVVLLRSPEKVQE